ncbi:MAG: class I SAM-dependent RNA methyltransferase [Nitratireductor sp.]|nr:class I SAM-dependent RNA methyltransferase [Nitratireductor sp.]
MTEEFTITRLGALGDGMAETASGPRHLPFTLPGETVRQTDHGDVEILAASDARIAAICRHFGTCGGCQMQHMRQDAYLAWKSDLVAQALMREGIDPTLQPIHSFGDGLRRRVVFTAIRARNGILFGFSRKGSNRIVDIAECPVLLPEITARLKSLKRLAAILATRKDVMKITVLACENGLDVAANNGSKTPEKAEMEAIVLATEAGFARLSLNGETLIEAQRPLLSAGVAKVSPPPGAFVQAVAAAEEVMAGLVSAHLRQCKSVADLFCGQGAFALRLAEHATVHAAESFAPALAALDRAWRETGGKLKQVKIEKRDLFRRPMMAAELKQFDGLVLDPPRAGAEAQCAELAKSAVKRIAAVSCNAKTLARDLRILADGGYRLISVTPIDQFVFTPHVEAVALLER